MTNEQLDRLSAAYFKLKPFLEMDLQYISWKANADPSLAPTFDRFIKQATYLASRKYPRFMADSGDHAIHNAAQEAAFHYLQSKSIQTGGKDGLQ